MSTEKEYLGKCQCCGGETQPQVDYDYSEDIDGTVTVTPYISGYDELCDGCEDACYGAKKSEIIDYDDDLPF